jgi:hypothetical protein
VAPDVFAEEDAWRRQLEEEYLSYHRWFREHGLRVPNAGWRSEYVEEVITLGYTTLLGDYPPSGVAGTNFPVYPAGPPRYSQFASFEGIMSDTMPSTSPIAGDQPTNRDSFSERGRQCPS